MTADTITKRLIALCFVSLILLAVHQHGRAMGRRAGDARADAAIAAAERSAESARHAADELRAVRLPDREEGEAMNDLTNAIDESHAALRKAWDRFQWLLENRYSPLKAACDAVVTSARMTAGRDVIVPRASWAILVDVLSHIDADDAKRRVKESK